VKATLKAKAFGSIAERLAGQAIGSIWKFSGHLASPRNGKQVFLHIQDIAASP
jgi:primosomal replication protein N